MFPLRTYDSAQVKITMMQMGGLGLLSLWLCRLTLAGRHAFNIEDLVCLSPFLAYLAVGIFSFDIGQERSLAGTAERPKWMNIPKRASWNQSVRLMVSRPA